MKIQEDNLFPIKLYTIRTELPTTHLNDWILEIKDTQHFHYGRDTGGWQGGEGLWKHELMSDFRNILTSKITEIFDRDFAILEMWGSVSTKGDYNKIHNHPALNPMYYDTPNWSGIFYLKTNVEGGELLIHSSQNITDTHSIKPNDGDIILFNSQTYHSVTPNLSDDIRICIAFNFRLL